ncbi:MAG: helix-turn-helix domain-containing protein [Clostridiales bacterium]|nr:helix-turn-helix domain-containing protein [Clostridiales bacterium]
MNRSIGDNISSLRRAKGLRQRDLGDLCGMADSRIGEYERDEHIPTKATLERIAKGLGVTVEVLLRGTEEETI